MNSITEFKREFSRAMRGYSPEEVDAAIEMLVSYGAELESANAEFAAVNDELLAEIGKLTAAKTEAENALAAAQRELAAFREKVGEAKNLIADARRAADQLRAEAEAEAAQIHADHAAEVERTLAAQTARCAAEERRYAALCRKTKTLTEAVRALYAEQMPAIEALSASIDADAAEPELAPAEEPEEAVVVFTPPVKKSPAPRVRRAAMAAAALEPDTVEVPARPAPRRPEPAAQVAEPAAVETEPAPIVPIPETPGRELDLTEIFADAPTQQFSVVSEDTMADGVNVAAVYRTASPTDLKVRSEKVPAAPAGTHSFAAVRRSLEEIGRKLDQE